MSQDVFFTPIIQQGNLLSITFPSEVARQMGLSSNDLLQITVAGEGMSLKRCDANVLRQLELANRIMEERRDVLRKLAE